ncbi:phytanoyl-CoA dioxygenase family protein [Armatimonas sp.]|uniref:phytanoyl-CoA dioxygenase family protein n=1 Tax=Armatimonas sp. TaxID=1872638 RepID=UPI00374C9DF8
MTITISDIEVFAESLDVARAATIYQEHGCLVVRGLMKPYIKAIAQEVELVADTARSLYAEAKEVPGIGWTTPDGTLWIKAPGNYDRDKQIMVLALRYTTSGAFLQSALDKHALDLVEAVLGPNIELFLDGQCLYKEPVGGHPKNLHQDSAYFEHRYDGPMASLNYVVDTDLVNGALHVVPGSHKLGQLTHIDTFSHLGLDPDEWPWERSLPICGKAGDAIFFNYRCIHGSKENHSEKPRPVFIHRYRRPDDYVTISAATAAAREEAEKHAAEVKKQNQQGLMVRGIRLWEPQA